TLFFAIFGAGAVAETVLRPAAPASAVKRALRVSATMAALIWLWTPLHFWPVPSLATPRLAATLGARALGRLLIPGWGAW
ncbi:MAG: hypothetical protein ABL955_06485, partial [Elusimicrobiota bacterium]